MFERAGLLFIFNFHPSNSFTDYRVGIEAAGEYNVVLSSDDKMFGGHERIDKSVKHFTTDFEWNNRKNFLQVCSFMRSTREQVAYRPEGIPPVQIGCYPREELKKFKVDCIRYLIQNNRSQ